MNEKNSSIEDKIKELEDWNVINGKLRRTIIFKDFIDAFSFLMKLAIISEKHDHHAEIYNVYNKVTIDLSTHHSNSITVKDIELAKNIDNILNKNNIK